MFFVLAPIPYHVTSANVTITVALNLKVFQYYCIFLVTKASFLVETELSYNIVTKTSLIQIKQSCILSSWQ